jgi:hypothetical protein
MLRHHTANGTCHSTKKSHAFFDVRITCSVFTGGGGFATLKTFQRHLMGREHVRLERIQSETTDFMKRKQKSGGDGKRRLLPRGLVCIYMYKFLPTVH